MQGIFRESGNNETVTSWKEAFAESDFVENFIRNHSIVNPFYILHPNDVASLLVCIEFIIIIIIFRSELFRE